LIGIFPRKQTLDHFVRILNPSFRFNFPKPIFEPLVPLYMSAYRSFLECVPDPIQLHALHHLDLTPIVVLLGGLLSNGIVVPPSDIAFKRHFTMQLNALRNGVNISFLLDFGVLNYALEIFQCLPSLNF
jgi:hypothetical protein